MNYLAEKMFIAMQEPKTTISARLSEKLAQEALAMRTPEEIKATHYQNTKTIKNDR